MIRRINDQQDVFILGICKREKKKSQTSLNINNINNQEGLAIIFWDKECFSLRRMNILHLTCLNVRNYQKILNEVINFIFVNDPCDEIRVNLFHRLNENQKLEADKEIVGFYKQLQFRWKIMNNDKYTDKRNTIYALKRNQF